MKTQFDFHKDAFYCEIIQFATELNYLNGDIHSSCFLSSFGHLKEPVCTLFSTTNCQPPLIESFFNEARFHNQMPYQQLIVNSVKSKASQRPLIKIALTSFKCFHFLCSQGKKKTESFELTSSLIQQSKNSQSREETNFGDFKVLENEVHPAFENLLRLDFVFPSHSATSQ